jgi:hypothetical protein
MQPFKPLYPRLLFSPAQLGFRQSPCFLLPLPFLFLSLALAEFSLSAVLFHSECGTNQTNDECARHAIVITCSTPS